MFEVRVYLNDLDPREVLVEIYADGVNGGSAIHQEMKRVSQLAGTSGGYVYSTTVSAARSSGDYTARLMPHTDGVSIPLEEGRILWQR